MTKLGIWNEIEFTKNWDWIDNSFEFVSEIKKFSKSDVNKIAQQNLKLLEIEIALKIHMKLNLKWKKNWNRKGKLPRNWESNASFSRNLFQLKHKVN